MRCTHGHFVYGQRMFRGRVTEQNVYALVYSILFSSGFFEVSPQPPQTTIFRLSGWKNIFLTHGDVWGGKTRQGCSTVVAGGPKRKYKRAGGLIRAIERESHRLNALGRHAGLAWSPSLALPAPGYLRWVQETNTHTFTLAYATKDKETHLTSPQRLLGKLSGTPVGVCCLHCSGRACFLFF